MDRREYLTLIGAVGTATLAGCSGDEPDVESADDDGTDGGTEPSEGDGTGDQSDNSGTSGDDTGSEEGENTGEDEGSEDDAVFELGETAAFSRDGQELEFQAHNARLTNVLTYNLDATLFSEVPRSDLFLLVDATIENVGDETAWVPSTIDLVVDGAQYEQSFVGESAIDSPYSNFTELRQSVEQTGTLVFSIPDVSAGARLFVEWGSFETATGEWQFDLAGVEREIHDYSGNSVGESVAFGTDERQYQLTVADIELTKTYTYEGYSGTQREQASGGQQWAIATIEVENTGSATVSVPSTFEMRLVVDNQQYDQAVYLGEGGHSGGNLSQGSSTEGVVLYEVPDSASEVRLEIDLTQDVTAVWNRN